MKFHSITFFKYLLCLIGEVNTLCNLDVLVDCCASMTNKIQMLPVTVFEKQTLKIWGISLHFTD